MKSQRGGWPPLEPVQVCTAKDRVTVLPMRARQQCFGITEGDVTQSSPPQVSSPVPPQAQGYKQVTQRQGWGCCFTSYQCPRLNLTHSCSLWHLENALSSEAGTDVWLDVGLGVGVRTEVQKVGIEVGQPQPQITDSFGGPRGRREHEEPEEDQGQQCTQAKSPRQADSGECHCLNSSECARGLEI